MWNEMETTKVEEADVQTYFKEWSTTRTKAGLPRWLADHPGCFTTERNRTSFGYSFRTDVESLVPPNLYVIELKSAEKYEPLALGEVLHHAEWIRRYDEHAVGQHVIPVIVSRFNSWLRIAISSLASGFVEYYELDVLAAESETILWFDAPLSPWIVKPQPSWLAELGGSALAWHEIATTGNWVGLKAPRPDRPPILDEPYVMAAQLDDGRALLWEGRPAANRTSAADAKKTTSSNYYLWDPRAGDAGAARSTGPTWLQVK